MQQAVLGCSQLQDCIPALASCFPSHCTPDPHRTRGGAGPKSKHTLNKQRGGRRESRKQGCPSRFPPPQAPLPHPATAHQEQGQIYHSTNQGRSICQQAWPGTHSLPWLFKDTRSRSHFLQQWILHGEAAMPHLLCSCSVKHLICCTAGSFHSSLPLHFASMAEQWKFSPLSLVNDLQGDWNLSNDLPGSVPKQLLRGAPENLL